MNTRTIFILMLLTAAMVLAVWLLPLNRQHTSEPAVDSDQPARADQASSDRDFSPVRLAQSSQGPARSHEGRITSFSDNTEIQTQQDAYDFDFEIKEVLHAKVSLFEGREPEVFIELIENESGLSADEALTLAMVYRICMKSPRTEWQYEQELDITSVMLPHSSDNKQLLEGLEYKMQLTELAYEICSTVDPDLELDREALYWLETAADLGHPQAQFAYYETARELLVGKPLYTFQVSKLGIRDPNLIFNYRIRSLAYLRSLLETGQPKAYLLNAMMLYQGDVMERDLLLSYANASLVESESDSPAVKEHAGSLKRRIEKELPQDELKGAKRLVSDLRKSLSR